MKHRILTFILLAVFLPTLGACSYFPMQDQNTKPAPLSSLDSNWLLTQSTENQTATAQNSDLSDQIALHRLNAATLLHQNKPLESAKELIKISDSEKSLATAQIIWQLLQRVPYAELSNTPSSSVNTWLMLTRLSHQYANDTPLLAQKLLQFQIENPMHPSLLLIPQADVLHTLLTPKYPEHIALLLPLQGNYARMGEAVRDGFLNAYQSKKRDNAQTIHFYDTSQMSVKDAYALAISQGADIVAGPLTKEEVSTLTDFPLTVPTLALNYTELSAPIQNLFEFGLSPDDEATQIADRAWQRGQSRAIVILADTDWGRRVTQAFVSRFESLGGSITEELVVSDMQDLDVHIAHLLRIDDSQARSLQLHSVMHQKFKSVPYRRQDVDMILIVGAADMARQVFPLLKFNYAQNLPVYATSSVYEGMKNSQKEMDLNGIVLTDIPWLIHPTADMIQARQIIYQSWPKNYVNHSRLYAMGYHAYTLIHQLLRLQVLPLFPVEGATGQITLDQNQQLHRTLPFAKISHGDLVFIP